MGRKQICKSIKHSSHYIFTFFLDNMFTFHSNKLCQPQNILVKLVAKCLEHSKCSINYLLVSSLIKLVLYGHCIYNTNVKTFHLNSTQSFIFFQSYSNPLSHATPQPQKIEIPLNAKSMWLPHLCVWPLLCPQGSPFPSLLSTLSSYFKVSTSEFISISWCFVHNTSSTFYFVFLS